MTTGLIGEEYLPVKTITQPTSLYLLTCGKQASLFLTRVPRLLSFPFSYFAVSQ